MTVIVFNAKIRSRVELSLIVAFDVVISSKNGRRNLVRERQLMRKHELLTYLSQPILPYWDFLGGLLFRNIIYTERQK